jgi:formylglycine-generating enzyme required for sulfatase activity
MIEILTIVGTIVALASLYVGWRQLRKMDAPPLRQVPSLVDDIEARYRQHLVDTYRYLDFKGIVQIEKLPIRLPLERVYVQLHARPMLPSINGMVDVRIAGRPVPIQDLAEGLSEKIARQERPIQPITIEEALSSHQGIVVLGDPGAGKSTILKYLALKFAQKHDMSAFGFDQPRLPILLPIAAYAAALQSTPHLSLESFLGEYQRSVRGVSYDLSSVFSAALSSGKAVVLLDGLDEVVDTNQRLFVTKRVEDFYHWYRSTGTRFVITSRIVGYHEAPLSAEGLAHFVLLDFSRTEITQFASNWATAFETAVSGENDSSVQQAIDESARILSAIFSSPSVERLAANPLLLTILALIHRQGTDLPRRRVELYELYIKTLVNSWARARNLDGRPIGPMDEVEAVKLLAPLAYWMHAERPSGTARKEDLEKRISGYYIAKRKRNVEDADNEAKQFLSDVGRYAGLLAERGRREFGFVHLTFEEYLAAREIIFQGQVDKQNSIRLIRKHMYDPIWYEVIRLAVGYASIIAKEEDAASLMINGLIENEADAQHRGHNILIAGESLNDVGAEGVSPECWQSVRKELAGILADATVPVSNRWRAGALLSELRDPRFDVHDQTPEIIGIRGGSLQMGTPRDQIQAFVSEVARVSLPNEAQWVQQYWVTTLESEAPLHVYEVSPYAIGKYPITNAQYKCFIDSNPQYHIPYAETERAILYNWDVKLRTHPKGRGNQPVVLVSWNDALAYCAWLNKTVGRTFRLPTEAEWEFAARGADGRLYPWGNNWDPFKANTAEQGAKGIVSVGCYPDGTSPFGLFDCTGQNWEWTSTAWGSTWEHPSHTYPYSIDGREDQTSDQWRVVRGGSWDDVAAFARCASRGPNTQSFRSHYIGFRIAEGIPSS